MEKYRKKTDISLVGIRPGEKLHEVLINQDELKNAFELENKTTSINKTNIIAAPVNTPPLENVIIAR